MSVLLAVTMSLINITLKQYQFAGISYDSETAFQAASAGMECAQFQDWVAKEFEVGNSHDSTTCFGVSSADLAGTGAVSSGEEQEFHFSWGNPNICTEISVFKFYNASSPVNLMVRGTNIRPGEPCPAGGVCTFIESRGYNVACGDISSSPRVVEREYSLLY
jgi:hypothetical protein